MICAKYLFNRISENASGMSYNNTHSISRSKLAAENDQNELIKLYLKNVFK